MTVATRFSFGANWADYADAIDERRLSYATSCLANLVGPKNLAGRRFLDIGCGSGLHAVAALRLGAASVTAIDFDPDSVTTTRAVLARFAPGAAARVDRADILAPPAWIEPHDVVYSWGVLHHTGAMWDALACAGRLVSPGGLFAFALYRRTRLCWAWRIEKALYCRAPSPVQDTLLRGYMAAYRARLRLSGQDPVAFERDYAELRGMAFEHNARDWIGGFPYESARPADVANAMRGLGFYQVTASIAPSHLGLFGSGCDEYLYRR